MSLWLAEEVGTTETAKREILQLFDEDAPFATPKPELLLRHILHIATNPGDLVLDSFLGSGTTAAVAHKMGRRWIGIEMGDHAVTHCAPATAQGDRRRAGRDLAGGGLEGGSGVHFYRLSEPVFDADGRTHAGYRFGNLAAHVWFSETGVALVQPAASPYLGRPRWSGYALLYNGVLGDRRPQGGNVLTNATLALIREARRRALGTAHHLRRSQPLSEARLRAEGITFKQTPYDVKAR
jgi:adenine-specific DNA-methyltransferase